MCDYVFFGHGWDTGTLVDTGNMPLGIELDIILLAKCNLLVEDPKYSKQRVNDMNKLSRKKFIKLVRKISLEQDNQFCVYNAKRGSPVPEVLLTTLPKLGKQDIENNMLVKQYSHDHPFGEVRLASKVYTLSELLFNTILPDMKKRKHASLLIYTCRSFLDEYQRESISKGGLFDDEYILQSKMVNIKTDIPKVVACMPWMSTEKVERYRKYIIKKARKDVEEYEKELEKSRKEEDTKRREKGLSTPRRKPLQLRKSKVV